MKKTATLIAAFAFISVGGIAHADDSATDTVDKGELLANTPTGQVRPANPDDLIIISCEEGDTKPECQVLEK